MDNPANPVFRLKVLPAGQQVVAQLHLLGFGSVSGSATVFDAKMPYVPGNGVRITAANLTFNNASRVDGTSRRLGTRFLDAALVDFVQIRDCQILGYDQTFRLTVPAEHVGKRANTQIIIEGVAVLTTNSLGYIDNSDLVRINVDALNVGGGLVIGTNTHRLYLDRYHVEAIAHGADWKNADDEAVGIAKFGWGLTFKDGANYGQVIVHGASIFATNTIEDQVNPGTPIGGVYVGKHDNGSVGFPVFSHCYISPAAANAPAWIPIEAHYNMRWEGRWISELKANVRLGNSGPADNALNDLHTDIVIDEGQLNRRGTRNLLPGTKLIHLTDKIGPGTVAVTEYSTAPFDRAHLATFTSTTSSTEIYRTVPLAVGWHTLLVSGRTVSGNPFVTVRTAEILLRKKFQNFSNVAPITFHMPFYVETAADYRVGIQSIDNATVIVDEIGLVKGLWPGDVPPGAWTYPPVTTLPAASTRWEGRGVTLLAGSNDSRIYVCVNSMLGYVWKQIA